MSVAGTQKLVDKLKADAATPARTTIILCVAECTFAAFALAVCLRALNYPASYMWVAGAVFVVANVLKTGHKVWYRARRLPVRIAALEAEMATPAATDQRA